jgi:hypothetical protein
MFFRAGNAGFSKLSQRVSEIPMKFNVPLQSPNQSIIEIFVMRFIIHCGGGEDGCVLICVSSGSGLAPLVMQTPEKNFVHPTFHHCRHHDPPDGRTVPGNRQIVNVVDNRSLEDQAILHGHIRQFLLFMTG